MPLVYTYIDVTFPTPTVKDSMAKTRPDNKVHKTTKPSPSQSASVNVATLFARPPKQDEVVTSHRRRPPHPDYLVFLDTTSDYRTNATASLATAVEQEKAILEARIHGEDLRGAPLDLPNVVTAAELDSLKAQADAINTSFASIEIHMTRTNSKGQVVADYCTMEETMTEFTRRSGALKTSVDGLIKELAGVETEIEKVMVGLKDGGNGTQDFKAELEDLIAESDEAMKATAQDVTEARREDKESGAERQQRLQDFLKTF
ncbi:hypothetical protein LTR95_010444 [Oleoguttula sp. CCFEE 5521]